MSNDYGLYEKLSAIGVCISSEPYPMLWGRSVDIEKTLMDSAEFILLNRNSRILSLLLSWIKYHGEQVNIERLKKLVHADKRDLAWINLFAFYGLHCKQTRWRILANQVVGRVLVNGHLKMVQTRANFKGEESWARHSGFIIPCDSEPADEKYVLTSQQLAQMNVMYRNRLIFGASWRADIVTAMGLGAQTPAEAARLVSASYEPAYRVFRDFERAGFLVKNTLNMKSFVA